MQLSASGSGGNPPNDPERPFSFATIRDHSGFRTKLFFNILADLILLAAITGASVGAHIFFFQPFSEWLGDEDLSRGSAFTIWVIEWSFVAITIIAIVSYIAKRIRDAWRSFANDEDLNP